VLPPSRAPLTALAIRGGGAQPRPGIPSDKEDGMSIDPSRELEGACHCGTVRFTVKLLDGFNTVRRCTCSYCRMRGAVAVSARVGDIKFLAGEAALTLYHFNTGIAEHYFCSKCGIYTHHRRRSNPDQYGVNIACLDGMSPFDFAEVPVYDGVSHPRDRDGSQRLVGYLRFAPVPPA
jgi:hypothetical protein